MTWIEIVRVACYVLASPALLFLAIHTAQHKVFAVALFYGSISLLFAWYVIEITLASTGLNTREYRVIGTPFVLSATVGVLWIVADLFHHLRIQRNVDNSEGGME